MIIRHMQGTFGTLDGEQLRLDTGLNIIYAPNESGKSTWCAFLRAMLYGIDTSQRARAGFVPDKQKYAPWSGKPMAGELELEQGGKCITIRRWTEAPNAPLRGFFGGVHRHGHPGAGPDGGGRGRAAHGRIGRGVRAHCVHRAGRPRRDGHPGAGKTHLRHRDLRRGGELLHRGRCPAARMAAPPAQRPARRAAGVGGPHHDGGRAAAPARAQRAGAGGLRRRAPADGRGAADRD